MRRLFLRQAFRIARRELRGGLRGFGVFLGCLFLGVFAISAVGSLSASARSGLLSDAKALLGGDLEIRLVHRQLEPEQEVYLRERGELSRVTRLRTMASDPGGERRTLVELKAVDSSYPLYGDPVLSPDIQLREALAAQEGLFGAVAEKALLERLDLAVGDRLQLGEARLRVTGVIEREPDRAVRAFSLGPRLMIAQEALEATGLVRPGSLVNYGYRLRLPESAAAETVASELRETFPDAGWRLRTWREAAPRVRLFLDRVELQFTLIGLCALLVGGLGVSGAVRGYLDGKTFHIATMKCLGASGGLIFSAYLLQVLAIGALGAAAGLACGAAVPYLTAALAGERLPFPLEPALFPSVLASAGLFGLTVALLFSLRALGVARRVPAAVLFRGYADIGKGDPGHAVRAGMGAASLLLVLLVLFVSSDRSLALWFVLGAAGCFLLFRFASAALLGLFRRLPRPSDPRLRLGMANLHRRGSPSAAALFSLGLGLTALVIIALTQANLHDLVTETVPGEAPAYFFFDIQPHQADAFEELVRPLPGVTRVERFPTLRGRISAIDGVPVEEAEIDPDVRWAVRGDRYLSYTGRLPEETLITAGRWWAESYQGPPLLSLTADLARGFDVGVGDTLTVDVLGREVTAEIASVREVDWSTLELNFALLFSPGVLEAAPQTHLAAVHVSPEGEQRVFREVTDHFPNVSAVGTREVLSNVARTIGRIGGAFRGMAALALISGLLVLAGALSADQHRRIRDAVIFKICGATRRDILTAHLLEFSILGLAAGLLSALIGSVAALGILGGLMEIDFAPHPWTVLLTLLVGTGATLLLGLAGTWKALGQKPAIHLRE